MTEIQKKMQELISKEDLDHAFAARFPKEMQKKLRNARAAVAGLGGLGSNIAVMLARSGIGKLLLVDFDVVDARPTSTGRCISYRSSESQRLKRCRNCYIRSIHMQHMNLFV